MYNRENNNSRVTITSFYKYWTCTSSFVSLIQFCADIRTISMYVSVVKLSLSCCNFSVTSSCWRNTGSWDRANVWRYKTICTYPPYTGAHTFWSRQFHQWLTACFKPDFWIVSVPTILAIGFVGLAICLVIVCTGAVCLRRLVFNRKTQLSSSLWFVSVILSDILAVIHRYDLYGASSYVQNR